MKNLKKIDTQKIKDMPICKQNKSFLSPKSIRSMAAIHWKIKEGVMSVRISDCNQTVKIWNNLGNDEEHYEMLEKVNTLITQLMLFRETIILNKIKEDEK